MYISYLIFLYKYFSKLKTLLRTLSLSWTSSQYLRVCFRTVSCIFFVCSSRSILQKRLTVTSQACAFRFSRESLLPLDAQWKCSKIWVINKFSRVLTLHFWIGIWMKERLNLNYSYINLQVNEILKNRFSDVKIIAKRLISFCKSYDKCSFYLYLIISLIYLFLYIL